MVSDFSEFVVYVDERGGHGLVAIGPQYPVFAMVFSAMRKTDYIAGVVRAVQRFKFRHQGRTRSQIAGQRVVTIGKVERSRWIRHPSCLVRPNIRLCGGFEVPLGIWAPSFPT